jgi:uncharacterized RDD family membrane protein YckC
MQGRRAGIVSRVLADAIDLLIVVAIAIVAYLGLSAALFIVRPARFAWPHSSTFLSSSVVALVLVLYLAIGWSQTGRTAGKQVMGLRLVNGRGNPPSLWSALLRAVLCVVFPIGLAWSAFDRRNRSLQDLLMRTSVLYDWLPHRAVRRDAHPRTEAVGRGSGTPEPTAPGVGPGSGARTETATQASGSEPGGPRT